MRTPEEVHALLASMSGDEKHEASSTSTLDALWVLYDEVLRVAPTDPTWEARDRFVLSKGHGCAAYYAVLAAKGFFPIEWLATFLEHDSPLGSHPDRLLVPGVEASTGSLGHGLSIGIGMMLGILASGRAEPRVVVLCGDGELNEGSCWEAILFAGAQRLDRLTMLLIDNHSSSITMPPWEPVLSGFGWDVRSADGHDREQLSAALTRTGNETGPVAVLADIPRGEW